jgi:hypothetical protein
MKTVGVPGRYGRVWREKVSLFCEEVSGSIPLSSTKPSTANLPVSEQAGISQN